MRPGTRRPPDTRALVLELTGTLPAPSGAAQAAMSARKLTQWPLFCPASLVEPRRPGTGGPFRHSPATASPPLPPMGDRLRIARPGHQRGTPDQTQPALGGGSDQPASASRRRPDAEAAIASERVNRQACDPYLHSRKEPQGSSVRRRRPLRACGRERPPTRVPGRKPPALRLNFRTRRDDPARSRSSPRRTPRLRKPQPRRRRKATGWRSGRGFGALSTTNPPPPDRHPRAQPLARASGSASRPGSLVGLPRKDCPGARARGEPHLGAGCGRRGPKRAAARTIRA